MTMFWPFYPVCPTGFLPGFLNLAAFPLSLERSGPSSLATADPADIPCATQYVRVALKERAAGQPISSPVTRPYGCSMKY